MPRKPKPLIDRIMALTVEVGDCLEWTGATNGGVPVASAGGRDGGKINVRRALYEATSFVPHKPGTCYSTKCRNKLCVKIDHIDARTRSKHQKIAAKERKPSVSRNLRIGLGKRKIPDAVYQAIMADHRTNKAIADDHGVSPYTVGRYKRGELRRSSNVFAGLM